MIPSREIGRRILAGIREMLWAAIGCSIAAAAIYRSRGDAIASTGGPTLEQLILVYFAVAIASGAVLGFLKPYTRGLMAGLLYIPIVWPYTFAVVMMSHIGRPSNMDRFDVIGSVIMAAIIGPIVAAFVHVVRSNKKT